MKQSDIGPFGVITLLLVLLAQVAVLFELYGQGWRTVCSGPSRPSPPAWR
ncbi:hypothetical protein SBADM41S_04981 [Streptomyces badius]